MTAPGVWDMPRCTTCGEPSVSATRWPDGRFVASCTEHLDGGSQVGLFTQPRQVAT